MLDRIQQILEEYIRPKLLRHYGDIKVVDFSENTLKVKLLGQCSNCPSAKFTIEDIVEKELKAHIPDIDKVILIEEISDDLINFAKSLLNNKE